MMKVVLLWSVLCALWIARCTGYPSGAPLCRCQDMTPHHKVSPLPGEPPFAITVSTNEHNNHTLNVTLFSTDQGIKFKGFLLEARASWEGEAVGQWTTTARHTKTLNCFDSEESAVTHYIDDDSQLGLDEEDDFKGFRAISFTWTPPSDVKHVKFIATVVKSYHKFYLNVSKAIKLKRRHKKVRVYY